MTTTHRKARAAAAVAAAGTLLAACGGAAEESATRSSTTADHSASASGSSEAMGGHDHEADGGHPPEGIEEAGSPTHPVGTEVTLTAGHMPGMKGADATISGAFDTTAYAVSYTPTDGGKRVTDHKWVVHEELEDPGEAPLAEGTEVVLDADHMAGMAGAEATIDSSTDETVYMVDVRMDDMTMTNHKWVVESEVR